MVRFVYRIKNWEYWPVWILYTPVFFAYLFFSLKARDFSFLFNVNPGFKNGGFVNISKKEIYDLIPNKYYPKTILLHPTNEVKINELLDEFDFPFIVKPDKGLRGIMVQKVYNQPEFNRYHAKIKGSYLVQELIPFENEIGIFYTRHPRAAFGNITGIVEKQFFTITGDGISTIEQLIVTDKRYSLQLKKLKLDIKIDLTQILPLGKKQILVPIGNHNLGTQFLDVSDKINTKITNTIDLICKQIEGFNYGRIDLKFKSWKDLENGKNMSIIEINGALSEPAHIYDPKYSFFRGVSEIIRHHKIMYEISIENKRRDPSKTTFISVMKELNTHFKEVAKLRG